MRISVHQSDHGYRLRYPQNTRVFVDGVEVRHCHTADTDLGEAHCYSEPLRVNSAGTRAEEIVLRGEVKITVDGCANG